MKDGFNRCIEDAQYYEEIEREQKLDTDWSGTKHKVLLDKEGRKIAVNGCDWFGVPDIELQLTIGQHDDENRLGGAGRLTYRA